MILFRFLGPIVILIGIFFFGYYLGNINFFKGKENESEVNKKYNIEFLKYVHNGGVIKSTVLVNKIVNFCDSIGIEIESLEIEDHTLKSSLVVKCNKNQHFLLIQEISKPEYQIELSNLTF